MNIDDVRRIQAEKDHLMRHEGKHPANVLHDGSSGRNSEDQSLFEKERESEDRMPHIKPEYPENMPRTKEPKYSEGKNLYKV